MAQGDFSNTDPNTTSGTALATKLDSQRDALLSNHSGSSAPSYVVAGMIWIDSTSSDYIFYVRDDGGDDVELFSIDASANLVDMTGVASINGGAQVGPAILVGEVRDYAGASLPTGWLWCAGQNVSRTTYSDLFSAIGTTFGSGDGSTTFGVPDLRGRTSVGKDDMGGTNANRMTGSSGLSPDGDVLGSAGGEEDHTLTVTSLPSRAIVQSGAFADQGTTGSTGRGSGGSHNNVQPSLILNKIIYAGV